MSILHDLVTEKKQHQKYTGLKQIICKAVWFIKKRKEGEIKRHVFVVLFIGFSGRTLRFCYGNESRPTANSPLVLPRR